MKTRLMLAFCLVVPCFASAGVPTDVADRTASITRFQKRCSEVGLPSDAMLVGIATSMEKILPRGSAFDLTVARQVELSLARNEKESVQIAALPYAY